MITNECDFKKKLEFKLISLTSMQSSWEAIDSDVPIIHSLKHIISPYSMPDIQSIFKIPFSYFLQSQLVNCAGNLLLHDLLLF